MKVNVNNTLAKGAETLSIEAQADDIEVCSYLEGPLPEAQREEAILYTIQTLRMLRRETRNETVVSPNTAEIMRDAVASVIDEHEHVLDDMTITLMRLAALRAIERL